MLIESVNSEGWRFSMVPQLLKRFPHPHTMLLSPDLVVAGEAVWRNLSKEVAQVSTQQRVLAR